MLKRLLMLTVVVALLAPIGASAQTSASGCPNVGRLAVPFAFETLTVTESVAVSLTAATYAPTGLSAANMAEITLSAPANTALASIRYRLDGTAPTPLVGHHTGGVIRLYVCGASNVARFQAIVPNASNAVSAVISATYYRVQ